MGGTPYTMSVDMALCALRVKMCLIWNGTISNRVRNQYAQHDVIVDSVVASETWRDDDGFHYGTQMMEV